MKNVKIAKKELINLQAGYLFKKDNQSFLLLEFSELIKTIGTKIHYTRIFQLEDDFITYSSIEADTNRVFANSIVSLEGKRMIEIANTFHSLHIRAEMYQEDDDFVKIKNEYIHAYFNPVTMIAVDTNAFYFQNHQFDFDFTVDSVYGYDNYKIISIEDTRKPAKADESIKIEE